MNLVTDGLPALALGVEPAEKNVMKRPPYSAAESIFGRGMVPFILIIGTLMSIASIGSAWELWYQRDPAWQTVLLTTLVFIQLAVALEARSEQEPLYRIGLLKNRLMVLAVVVTVVLQLLVVYLPAAQLIFGTRAMTMRDLAISIGLPLPVLICIEVWKATVRRGRP
jgi:Ca2+-transporting ATPase